MKCIFFIGLFQCLTSALLSSQSNPVPLITQTTKAPITAFSQADPKIQSKILEGYGKLALSFEANHGQLDARVKFVSRTSGYSLFLTGDEAVFAMSGNKLAKPKGGAVLRMKFLNANPATRLSGVDKLPGTSSYFIGNDRAKWRTNVPTFAKVKYEGIYSGIDLIYYGNRRQLEYDFIVAPRADPRQIVLDIGGAKEIRQGDHGDIVLLTDECEIRWHKPVVYQEKLGRRQEIAARYDISDNRVGFELAEYDKSRPLYIDPLIYSTYLGGSDFDWSYGIAVDAAGDAYVAGWTNSSNFPTMNPSQPTYGGSNSDAFVAKLNPSGSALVYSTYLGGTGDEEAYGIAVDNAGNAYVTGWTSSTDFPTMNPFQPAYGGGQSDAFVTKLNPEGSALVYSTYLGGNGNEDYVANSGAGIAIPGGGSIAVDSVGNAYVTGSTTGNFPTMNPLQPTYGGGSFDAFVSKLNAVGSAFVYSTYLGGSGLDYGAGIAVDSTGNVYINGTTASRDFPTMNPLQPAYGGGQSDAFVTKLNPEGSALAYSTYLGGSGFEEGSGIAVDSSGNTYVTGWTSSTDFPTMNPFQPARHGGSDAFVSKLNPAASAFVYSTYLGGNSLDYGSGIAVDNAGNAYVTGGTESTNFPTMNPLQPTYGGGSYDAFVSQFGPNGNLGYSTFLGGSGQDFGASIAVDIASNAYVTGSTASTNFPTGNPLQAVFGGGLDAFVGKIDVNTISTTTRLVSSLNPSVSGKVVTFTATMSSASGGAPTGKVTFLNGSTALATKTLSGGAASFRTSKLRPGLNSITAVYGGDSNYTGSVSIPVNQLVLVATTTTLSASPNPSSFGQAVTFVAAVTSSSEAPPDGELVMFMKGTTVLGTGSLSNGSATFTSSILRIGTNLITAVYGGDSNFAGSKSKAVKQVVDKAAASTTLGR